MGLLTPLMSSKQIINNSLDLAKKQWDEDEKSAYLAVGAILKWPHVYISLEVVCHHSNVLHGQCCQRCSHASLCDRMSHVPQDKRQKIGR